MFLRDKSFYYSLAKYASSVYAILLAVLFVIASWDRYSSILISGTSVIKYKLFYIVHALGQFIQPTGMTITNLVLCIAFLFLAREKDNKAAEKMSYILIGLNAFMLMAAFLDYNPFFLNITLTTFVVIATFVVIYLVNRDQKEKLLKMIMVIIVIEFILDSFATFTQKFFNFNLNLMYLTLSSSILALILECVQYYLFFLFFRAIQRKAAQ
jgi:hypothetical protein